MKEIFEQKVSRRQNIMKNYSAIKEINTLTERVPDLDGPLICTNPSGSLGHTRIQIDVLMLILELFPTAYDLLRDPC